MSVIFNAEEKLRVVQEVWRLSSSSHPYVGHELWAKFAAIDEDERRNLLAIVQFFGMEETRPRSYADVVKGL